jgi:HD-GYP domain-containing protein (c-di-GMP phosphodiesterase class II)
MPFVSVSQLKPGDIISRDVMTQKENLLMTKGTILSDRELEILSAFLIAKVHIEATPGTLNQAEDNAETQVTPTILALYDAYDQMVVLLRRVFNLAATSGTIPILDIRNTLASLVSLSEAYNIISFKPPKYYPRDYLIHNSVKASLTSYVLAKWLGFTQKDLMPIALGGLLHDIGNAKIDSAYFMKTSGLSAIENEEIKMHPILGYQILKNVPSLNEGCKLTALQHHERLDGSGYPSGLRSENIHPYSRIIAIADVYHAMSSQRLHREPTSPYLVMEELSKESFGKLDPAYVQTFIHKISQFHTGMIVKLSDNRIGEIIFSQREHPTRPWVNVSGKIINLTMERSIYIKDVIQ